MGAFELPLLIIAWFVAICLIAPVILAVLVFIIGVVCSVLIKITDKSTDSDNLLDNVKPPKPVDVVKPVSVKQSKQPFTVGFCYEDMLEKAKQKRVITHYIRENYNDKYSTFKDFDVVHKEFSNVLILKDKDGNVLGKEEMSLLDLWMLREELERKGNLRITYSDLFS